MRVLLLHMLASKSTFRCIHETGLRALLAEARQLYPDKIKERNYQAIQNKIHYMALIMPMLRTKTLMPGT
jgi:hypothetical protein